MIDYRIAFISVFFYLFPHTLTPNKHPGFAWECKFFISFRGFEVIMRAKLQMILSKGYVLLNGSSALNV